MILTDTDIKKAVKAGNIEISDFNESMLGSNSYDLTLAKTLGTYTEEVLDARIDNPFETFDIPPSGFILQPNQLYLGVTNERTKSRIYAPFIEGKSSIGRLGMSVHVTAGVGDIGFNGHWTLEITVVKPLKVYYGMPVAQIMYFLPLGTCARPYYMKESAKYRNQERVPVPSKMWKNFPETN